MQITKDAITKLAFNSPVWYIIKSEGDTVTEDLIMVLSCNKDETITYQKNKITHTITIDDLFQVPENTDFFRIFDSIQEAKSFKAIAQVGVTHGFKDDDTITQALNSEQRVDSLIELNSRESESFSAGLLGQSTIIKSIDDKVEDSIRHIPQYLIDMIEENT